jgi:hypothetical protein
MKKIRSEADKPIYVLIRKVREAVAEYDKSNDHLKHDHLKHDANGDCIRCRLVDSLPGTPSTDHAVVATADNPMPPYDLRANLSQMNREHAAWRQVCWHLEKLSIDINSQDPLACAIRLWGEELVALRESNPKHTAKALAECRTEYLPHVIRDDKP